MNYYEFLDLCFSKMNLTIRYDNINEPFISCGADCNNCPVISECKEQSVTDAHAMHERDDHVKRYLKDHPEYLI